MKTNNFISIPSIALKTVYILNADPTYDVWKGETNSSELIALRTVAGSGNINIEGFAEITVTPGTLILLQNKKVKHYYCSSNIWDFWWFEFSLMGELCLPLNTIFNIEMLDDEVYECRSCLELLRRDNNASNSLASATFNMILYKWLMFSDNKRNNDPYRNSINKVISYVKSDLSQTITVKDMAVISGLCERRFRQIFKDIMGLPPKKYFDKMRNEISQELLKNTLISIAEISEMLGYYSQFHFSKIFKETNGMAPLQFRMIYRKM